MSPRATLSLQLPLNRRRGSQSQPSSPKKSPAKDFQPSSATTPPHSPSTLARMSRHMNLRELKSMARKTTKEVEALVRNDWQWPPPAEDPSSIRPGVNIAEGLPFVERELELTPPPDEEASPTSLGTVVREDVIEPIPLTPDERKRLVTLETAREMNQNSGLHTFVERRNAWTGAVVVDMPEGADFSYNNVQDALLVAQWKASFTRLPSSPSRSRRGSNRFGDLLVITPYQAYWDEFLARNAAQSMSHRLQQPPATGSTARARGRLKPSGLNPSATPPGTRPAIPAIEPPRTPPSDGPRPPFIFDPSAASTAAVAQASANPSTSGSATQPATPTIFDHPAASASRQPLTLIPTYRPLIHPEHPARQESQDVNTYGKMYRTIVEEGKAPNIPINLSDVVGCIVWGWKSTGEWPEGGRENSTISRPTPEPAAPSVEDWEQRMEERKRQLESEKQNKRKRGSLRGFLGLGGSTRQGDGKEDGKEE